MSEANRELVRSLQVPPEADVAILFTDPGAWAAFSGSVSHLFVEDFECAAIGATHNPLEGIGFDGLRELWFEWLAPWSSYRSEVEDVVADGNKVMVLVRDYAVAQEDGLEVELRAASVWTVRDGKVARLEFHLSRDSARASFEA